MKYEIPLNDFLKLFCVKPHIIDFMKRAICEDQRYYFDQEYLPLINNLLGEISNEIGVPISESDDSELYYIFQDIYVIQKDIPQIIVEIIESWFNNKVSRLFDTPVTMNLTHVIYNDNETVEFNLECENLSKNIGMGMNAWGVFDWQLHSEEDKQTFIKDGYLALRELLHYYIACESKININLDELDTLTLFTVPINPNKYVDEYSKKLYNGEWIVCISDPVNIHLFETDQKYSLQEYGNRVNIVIPDKYKQILIYVC